MIQHHISLVINYLAPVEITYTYKSVRAMTGVSSNLYGEPVIKGGRSSLAVRHHRRNCLALGDLRVRSLCKRFDFSGLLPQLCDQPFVGVRSDDFGELFAVAVD